MNLDFTTNKVDQMSSFPQENLYFEGFNGVRKLWISLSNISDPEERVKVLREKQQRTLPRGGVDVLKWNPRTCACEIMMWQSDLYCHKELKADEGKLEKLWDTFVEGKEVSFHRYNYVDDLTARVICEAPYSEVFSDDILFRGKIVRQDYEYVTVELFSPFVFVTETVTKRFLRNPLRERRHTIKQYVEVSYFNLLN